MGKIVLKFQENSTTTRFRIGAQTQTPILLGQTIVCFDTEYKEWPTQISLWAAFEKIDKNIDFLGRIMTKN
jgi:hypothetical protein